MDDTEDFENHQSQKSLSGLLQILHHLQLHPTIRITLPIPTPVSEVVSDEEIESTIHDEREQMLLNQRLEPSIEYPLHAPTDYPYAPTQNPFYDPDQANILTLLSTVSTLLSTGEPSSHFSATIYSLGHHILLIAKSTIITHSDEKWARKLHFLLTDQRPEPKMKRMENRSMYVEQEMFPFIIKRCSCALNKRIRGLREVLDLDFGRVRQLEVNRTGTEKGAAYSQTWHDKGWEAVGSSSVVVDWLTTLRTSDHLKGRPITGIFRVTHSYLKGWKVRNSEVEKFLLGILCNMSILLNDLKFPTSAGGVDEDVDTNVDRDRDMDIDPSRPWSSKWSTLTDAEKLNIRRFMLLLGYCQILYSSKLLQYLAWNPDDGYGGDPPQTDDEDEVADDKDKENDAMGGHPGDAAHRANDGHRTAHKEGSSSLSSPIPNENPNPRGRKRKRSPSPSSSPSTPTSPISPTVPTAEVRDRHNQARRVSQRKLALKIRRRLWKLMIYVDEVTVLVYRVQQTYPDGRAPYCWVGERAGKGKRRLARSGPAGNKGGCTPSDTDVEAEPTRSQEVCSNAEVAIEDAFWTVGDADGPSLYSLSPGKLALLHYTHTTLFENWSTIVPSPPKEISLHPEIKLMLLLDVHPSCSTYRQQHPLEYRTPIGSSKRTCWCCAVWLSEFWNEGNDLNQEDDYEMDEEDGESLRGLLSTTPKCFVGDVRPFADWDWALPDAKVWAPDSDEKDEEESEEMWQRRRTMHAVVQGTNMFTLGVIRERLREILGR